MICRGCCGACWVGQALVAVKVAIVPFPILTLGASTVVSHSNPSPFTWSIDAFNALSATALAGGHVSGTSGLATVAAQTSLSHTTTRQSAGQSPRVRIVVRARKSEALAVGTNVAGSIATNFPGTTGGAGQGRLFRLAIGRIGVGSEIRVVELAMGDDRNGGWCWGVMVRGIERNDYINIVRVVARGGGEIHGDGTGGG